MHTVLSLSVGVLLAALSGCETDVDSPFTQVSAGGTGTMPTTTPPDEGSSSSTGEDPEGSSGDPTTTGQPTGDPTTSATTDDATTGSDPCVPDPCVAPEVCVDGVCLGAAAPAAGDVVITEFHPNPDAVADDAGEWFELSNLSAQPAELQGCELSDQGSDSHVIGSSVIVPAGGLVVLGRAASGNGGVSLDYVYGTDISLGNDGDELALRCGGTLVDEVVYASSWPFSGGVAVQLAAGSGTANDDVGNWCEATANFGDGDLGTPGTANGPC